MRGPWRPHWASAPQSRCSLQCWAAHRPRGPAHGARHTGRGLPARRPASPRPLAGSTWVQRPGSELRGESVARGPREASRQLSVPPPQDVPVLCPGLLEGDVPVGQGEWEERGWLISRVLSGLGGSLRAPQGPGAPRSGCGASPAWLSEGQLPRGPKPSPHRPSPTARPGQWLSIRTPGPSVMLPQTFGNLIQISLALAPSQVFPNI